MLMPSIFGENFMDDFFGVPERTYTQSAQNALMKTDVVENKDGFDVSIDLPGFKIRRCEGRSQRRLPDHHRIDQTEQRREKQRRQVHPQRKIQWNLSEKLLCRRRYHPGRHQSKI